MSNTITLPEDTAGAKAQLGKLLVDPAEAVYLFIFGSTDAINAFAKEADDAAGGADRRVVRRSQCKDILASFQALKIDPEAGDLNSPSMVGFSTSGDIVIADVVLSTENLNSARAAEAFMLAEGEKP